MSDKSGTKLDIDSMTSIVILITLLVLLSLPISVSSALPQKVTSTGHSTTNKSEIENLTIADAAIPTIDSKTLNNIGNNLSSQGKYKLALIFYERALAISPSNVRVLIDKAEVLSKLSRYEDAINTYNKALAIQPSNLTILFDKAIIPLTLWVERALIFTILEDWKKPFPILIRF
jgi:tetratricopeptide (TPR) repeat protein